MNVYQLAACVGSTFDRAADWHDSMTRAMQEWGITTPQRKAAFLAQVGHESAGLALLEENLNYTAQRLMTVWPRRFPSLEHARHYEHSPEALANLVYANRLGNGTIASGDGWRFHGRGPIQLTGRANYVACGSALGIDLTARPEALLRPEQGSRSAGWFFASRGLNELADGGDIDAVSRVVNGGNLGLADRATRYRQALKVLQSPPSAAE